VRIVENGYLKTATMAASGFFGESPFFLLDYALRLLRVVVLLALWRTVLLERAQTGPMGLGQVLTYTLIAEVFAEQLNLRTSLNQTLWEGTLVVRFLRPMGLIRQLASEMAGQWSIDLVLFSIPLFAIAPLLGVDPRPVSVQAGLLFVPSLALAIIVGLAMEQLFGALVVALEQPVWLVEYVRGAIALLLSGQLLPLAYYPAGVGELFGVLPFAAMAWAPLAIYTEAGNPLALMGAQLLWAIILWPLANWLWRANREKLASHGG
jgi:viologen exporter family transport system permease protein